MESNAPGAYTRYAKQIREHGFVVLPSFLPEGLVERLKPEVDQWVDEGWRAKSIACCIDPKTHGVPPVLELELHAHAELLTYRPLLVLLELLMGPGFAFHHLHSDRQAPELPGKAWHHDYEQVPQRSRTHVMVHAIHYLDGLDGDTSGLAVLPGSHREVAEKTAREHLGTTELHGETLISDLPRGSTVVLHSAICHARRRPADEAGRARYMVDASYCEGGAKWPPVKPFWRHVLRRARELSLDRGEWVDLFAEHHFSEYVTR